MILIRFTVQSTDSAISKLTGEFTGCAGDGLPVVRLKWRPLRLPILLRTETFPRKCPRFLEGGGQQLWGGGLKGIGEGGGIE